ncbi:MAG: hypothetical protein QNJ63_21115 [Calothrix sp. MO_192.B10]|nr:hypothetical protein [Calothrix sp. MO_192.B10]
MSEPHTKLRSIIVVRVNRFAEVKSQKSKVKSITPSMNRRANEIRKTFLTEERQKAEGRRQKGLKNLYQLISPLHSANRFQAPEFIRGKDNNICIEMRSTPIQCVIVRNP